MVFLQKLTEKLHLEERVHLLGYRTDIPDLLGGGGYFLMPSRREGCGMAALEAMAAGLPLITVRNHGTKVYAEKGESAFCLKVIWSQAVQMPLHSWQRISCSAGKWVPTTVPQQRHFPTRTE